MVGRPADPAARRCPRGSRPASGPGHPRDPWRRSSPWRPSSPERPSRPCQRRPSSGPCLPSTACWPCQRAVPAARPCLPCRRQVSCDELGNIAVWEAEGAQSYRVIATVEGDGVPCSALAVRSNFAVCARLDGRVRLYGLVRHGARRRGCLAACLAAWLPGCLPGCLPGGARAGSACAARLGARPSRLPLAARLADGRQDPIRDRGAQQVAVCDGHPPHRCAGGAAGALPGQEMPRAAAAWLAGGRADPLARPQRTSSRRRQRTAQ
jgi:hypothetical protein